MTDASAFLAALKMEMAEELRSVAAHYGRTPEDFVTMAADGLRLLRQNENFALSLFDDGGEEGETE